MNRDTVNPMPATAETATIIGQLAPSGRRARPVRVANQAAPVMPTALPTTRPSTMPAITTGTPGASTTLARTATPALARANSGRTTKLDHGWRRWPIRSAGDALPRAGVSTVRTGANLPLAAFETRPVTADARARSGDAISPPPSRGPREESLCPPPRRVQ